MVLYGVYYGAYKIANFLYICFFGFSPHKHLYEEKTRYQNFRIFDHFTRVLYERRYVSHMLHRHLRYGGSRYGGKR